MHRRGFRGQSGLTLVELLIAVAINLFVVLIAAYLYLNGRATQQAIEERSAIFENGQLALELLGKEVGNAGYYPSHMAEPGGPVVVGRGQYVNPKPVVSAWAHGVFGCLDGYFDGASCQASDATRRGDGLVLNYFTEDAMTLAAGTRADCQGHAVDNATDVNTDVRLGAAKDSPNLAPTHPLFVSNSYTLTRYDYTLNSGNTLKTFGLACRGNGSAAPTYQVLVPGIEQFRVRYGLRDAAGQRAVSYKDAKGVTESSAVIVNGEAMQGWARVVSIQVCLVARSLTETKLRGVGDETRVDCEGNVFPSDGVQRRRFEQIFALKNRLS